MAIRTNTKPAGKSFTNRSQAKAEKSSLQPGQTAGRLQDERKDAAMGRRQLCRFGADFLVQC